MKKTGSATAAAAIALHGFKMEVLATVSNPCTCGTPEVEIGRTVVYTHTFTAGSEAGLQSIMTLLEISMNAANGFLGQESLLQQQGFACTPQNGDDPLMAPSHEGQRNPITSPAPKWKMGTSSWGPAYQVGTTWKSDCTITATIINYTTVSCP